MSVFFYSFDFRTLGRKALTYGGEYVHSGRCTTVVRPIHPAVQEWFERCAEFAAKFDWPSMPMLPPVLRMYGRARGAVKAHGETWPTWKELEAGAAAASTWSNGGWRPSRPNWIVACDRGGFPNILALRNYGKKAETKPIQRGPALRPAKKRDQ